MILFLFFCSGATALVYEVIWCKHLTLLFGSTIQAQTVVLAVFMGGLALGNKLFSRHADQARQPLALYGRIEISVAIYAFFFPWLYTVGDRVFAWAGSHLLAHSDALLLLKGLISCVLLLGPTILMGGTLPVLAAWLQQTTADAGRRSARFYSTNSLGAVCGAGLAGFLFVPWLGLRTTVEMAAGVNLLVGVIALGLAERKSFSAVDQPPTQSQSQSSQTGVPALDAADSAAAAFRWGCLVVALTGAVSMSMEVLASRCLALVFGASSQVFAIVLMAFILGIGLGSAVVASSGWKRWPKEIIVTLLLLVATSAIGLLVFNIEKLATIYLYFQSGLTRTLIGYWYHQFFTTVVSMGVIGLPAAALGAVLPLCIRNVGETTDRLGNHVGRLLTWNTLGAVVGVLVTGFILMPQIGLRGSFAVMGFVLVGVVLLIGLTGRRPVIGVLGVLCAIALGFATAGGGEAWRNTFSIGIFRLVNFDVSQSDAAWKSLLEYRRKFEPLVFYEDAADATVSVERQIGEESTNELVLRINGKPDASAYADRPTQILLAQLPLMVRPDSKDVFCFGMGSGITAGSVLGYPIEHLTIAENCEPVLRAAKLFSPWNHGVLTNDRVRIYHEDARTVLKLSPQQYDVVISEPSNPWTVGVGSVFSKEFYQLAARRLKPGGLMTQWFHMYEMDDRTLYVVLRTFNSVFPKMEIWDAGDDDIILLGSDRDWPTGPDVYMPAFQLDQPRADLVSIGQFKPETVLARQFASRATSFAVAGSGRIQSDDLPILEYEAPKAFYLFLGRDGLTDFPNYDERTWQMDLAPLEKNALLAKLSLDDLAPSFHNNHVSGNSQLQSYLDGRYQGKSGSMAIGGQVMPCVFRDLKSPLLVYAAPGMQTNLITRQLYIDEAALLSTNPSDRSNAVHSIQGILNYVKDYHPQTAGWPAAHYADLAVKASLRAGNQPQAAAILARGLQLDPDSTQLQYLSRVLAGDGPNAK